MASFNSAILIMLLDQLLSNLMWACRLFLSLYLHDFHIMRFPLNHWEIFYEKTKRRNLGMMQGKYLQVLACCQWKVVSFVFKIIFQEICFVSFFLYMCECVCVCVCVCGCVCFWYPTKIGLGKNNGCPKRSMKGLQFFAEVANLLLSICLGNASGNVII